MGNLPQIDMIKTGKNITQLRKRAGLTVKDLQDTFWLFNPAGNIQMAAWYSTPHRRQSSGAIGGSACFNGRYFGD